LIASNDAAFARAIAGRIHRIVDGAMVRDPAGPGRD
jgi:hypothetical protein